MKTKISLFACIALMLCSCSGFLEEDTRGRQEQSTFYTSDDLAFAALAGIYERMYSGDGLRQNMTVRQEACSDLHTYKPVASADAVCFPKYTLTPEQTHVITGWTRAYLVIFTANEFIHAMEVNDVISADAKTEFIREAKVLRAYMYYHLVNRWGDVPLIVESVDPKVTDRARTPKAQIWEYLVSDLEDASNLPAKGEPCRGGGALGRINKGAAMFLLAKVHLANVEDADGTEHFSRAKAVLDNFPAGYSLMPSINKVWDITAEYNDESIFELSNTSNQLPQQGLPGLGLWIPTGNWRGANGTFPVNDYLLRLAGWGNWDTADQATSWYQTPGLSERTLLYYSSNPITGVDPANLHTQYKYNKNSDGTTVTVNFTTNALAYCSHLMKFVDLSYYDNYADHAVGNTDMNYIFFRYADVVLMKAEVECEIGSQTAALTLLNSIRKRTDDVGDKLYTMTAPGGENEIFLADKAALREAVRNERALELVGEGWRFYDLKRWGNQYALAKLRESRQVNIPGTTEDYKPEDLTNITENKLLWPIPEGEIEGNGAMVQNPL
jgi:hypothetical protein